MEERTVALGSRALQSDAWRAGVIAAVTAGLLALAKITAGVLGHSSAITASAVDSGMDLLVSTMNAVAIRKAAAEPDREHPFGHGKIEALATSLQGLLVVGSSLYLLYRGIGRVVSPEPLGRHALTMGTMGVVTLVNIGLVTFMRRTAKKTGSSALYADSVHYASDIAQNLAVLAGVGATYATGWFGLDGALTIAVAFYIARAGWQVLQPAVNELIDTRGDEAQVSALERELKTLRARGTVDGFHGLRTRVSGRKLFVEVHIELPPDMRLARAHRISDEVRDALVRAVPEAEVLVHVDVEHDVDS